MSASQPTLDYEKPIGDRAAACGPTKESRQAKKVSRGKQAAVSEREQSYMCSKSGRQHQQSRIPVSKGIVGKLRDPRTVEEISNGQRI